METAKATHVDQALTAPAVELGIPDWLQEAVDQIQDGGWISAPTNGTVDNSLDFLENKEPGPNGQNSQPTPKPVNSESEELISENPEETYILHLMQYMLDDTAHKIVDQNAPASAIKDEVVDLTAAISDLSAAFPQYSQVSKACVNGLIRVHLLTPNHPTVKPAIGQAILRERARQTQVEDDAAQTKEDTQVLSIQAQLAADIIRQNPQLLQDPEIVKGIASLSKAMRKQDLIQGYILGATLPENHSDRTWGTAVSAIKHETRRIDALANGNAPTDEFVSEATQILYLIDAANAVNPKNLLLEEATLAMTQAVKTRIKSYYNGKGHLRQLALDVEKRISDHYR